MRNLRKTIGLFILIFMALVAAPNLCYAADGQQTTNVWQTKANMLLEKYGFETEVINGKIYSFGGYDKHSIQTNTVEVYDASINKWTNLAPMPNSRSNFKTEVIDGKIYALGGIGRVNNKCNRTVEVYDPATDKWTSLASMSTERHSFESQVLDGRIYVMGGNTDTSQTNNVEVYDPTTNKWSSVAPMSIERTYFQSQVLNGKIYVMGGYNKGYPTNNAEVYDPTTNKWSSITPMSGNRSLFRSEVIDGKIYVIGGSTGGGTTNTAEVYDPATNIWTYLPKMSVSRERCRTEVIKGKLYVLGGCSTSTGPALNSVEVYDPATNNWTSLASMNTERHSFQTEVLGSNIYSLGGSSNKEITSAVETYEIASEKLSTPINVTALAGNKQVTLTWDAVAGATSYNLKRSITSGGPYTTHNIEAVSGSSLSVKTFTDKGLENGTTYYYTISAIKSGTESDNSSEVFATPNAPNKIVRLVLEVNDEKQLSVSKDLSDNEKMIWTTSDSSIATVDTDGKVKALKPGNTVISCTSKDGSYIETINVLVVDLDYQLAVDLNIGEKCKLAVDNMDDNENVTWTAYDSTIATVTGKGKVSAVKEGLTYITAIDEQGNEIGRIYIRVK